MQKPRCDETTTLLAVNKTNIWTHEQLSETHASEVVLHSFFVIDTNGYFVGWNASLHHKAAGKPVIRRRSINAIDKFIYHADQTLIKEKLLKVLTYGLEETVEARAFFQGDQELRWFMIRGRRIMMEGNPFVICMIDDISAHKQEEESLTHIANQYRSITEHIDGVIFVADTNSIFRYISPNAEQMFGFMPDEMNGQAFAGFLEDETEIPVTFAVIPEQCPDNLPAQIFELQFRRKNGTRFWGELHLQFCQKNGNPHIVGLIHDVTVRKHREQFTLFQLSLSKKAGTCSIETLLQDTLDEVEELTSSSIGFCYFLRDDMSEHSLQVLSTEMHKKLGMPDGKVEPCSWNQTSFLVEALRVRKAMIHNDDDPVEICSNRSDNNSEFSRTLVIPIMKGQMVTGILGVGGKSSSYDEHDEKLVKSFADFACEFVNRMRREESEKNLQLSLIQAQKVALVGKFIQKMGGNYNYLLEIIYDNVQMAMEQETLSQSLKKNLRNILETTCNSSLMMSQLLTFARSESIMPIVIELNILVEGMMTTLKKQAGDDIDIVWIPDKQRTLVKMDPSQIDQLIGVLFLNALDAIESAGKITIQTDRISIDQSDCTSGHPCQVPGDYVSLSVRDNGVGIDTKDFPYIFEPFFSTKNDEGRLGLGLPIVYGIAQQNQGSVDCQSEVGNGSTFTVYLRRHTGNDYFSEDETPAATFQLKETILLVENEPDILNHYKRMLENTGYTVLAFATSEEAFRIASKYNGDIDLLITDVVLLEENGCDLCNKLLLIYPKLKTLYISDYHNDFINRDMLQEEGIGFIRKPFFINELPTKVHELLNSVVMQ